MIITIKRCVHVQIWEGAALFTGFPGFPLPFPQMLTTVHLFPPSIIIIITIGAIIIIVVTIAITIIFKNVRM